MIKFNSRRFNSGLIVRTPNHYRDGYQEAVDSCLAVYHWCYCDEVSCEHYTYSFYLPAKEYMSTDILNQETEEFFKYVQDM